MTKYLLVLIIVLAIQSCGKNIITQSPNIVSPYIVSNIETSFDKDYGDTLCVYYLNTYHGWLDFDDEIEFLDTIGKYKIGDSLKAEFIKQ